MLTTHSINFNVIIITEWRFMKLKFWGNLILIKYNTEVNCIKENLGCFLKILNIYNHLVFTYNLQSKGIHCESY